MIDNSSSESNNNKYPVGKFTSKFTGDEAFLADHIIMGKKVLPGTAYLELARAAVVNSVNNLQDFIIELAEAIFIQPIIVTQASSIEVNVYPGANLEFGVEVTTKQGVHFQTKAYLRQRTTQLSRSNEDAIGLNLEEIKLKCQRKGLTKEAFYSNFLEKGIDLGPSHQGIEAIRLGENCALIKATLPGSSNQGMGMDPGMLDSFIQSASVFAQNLKEGVQLPFAIKKLTVYGPLTDQMYAYLEKTDLGVNYKIADIDGNLKVKIDEFMGREIESDKNSVIFYKPCWNEQADDQSNENLVSQNVSKIYIDKTKAPSNYYALVRKLLNVTKDVVAEKLTEHTIEVNLTEGQENYRGVLAALKTISLEYPKIDYRLKFNNKIITVDYHAYDMPVSTSFCWKDNKTILISGGLGGVGKLIASDILNNSNGCTVVLVGRTKLNEIKQKLLKDLSCLNGNVVYETCDLSSRKEVDTLINQYPHIDGIIHGAGVLHDNFISKKENTEIDKVLSPKVTGLENLDLATSHIELDYFVALSSIAGTLGNAGQLDYAAANGYMDAYMQGRQREVKNRSRYGTSISINWPLWESDGMQVDDETRKNLMHVLKIKPLPSEQGLMALRQAIGSKESQLLVLYGNRKPIEKMIAKLKRTPQKTNRSNTTQVEPTNGSVDKLLRAILKEVKLQTAEHLKRKPNELDETADWAEFGFDSILLASFVNRCNSHFGLNLMPTVFFEATNIQLFAQYLAENHAQEATQKLSLDVPKMVANNSSKLVKEPRKPATQELQNISSFAQTLKQKFKAATTYRDKDIAIVGISCKIAGADSLDKFWEMLDQEKDMITEIPKDRWLWQDYPESREWGSFIDGVKEFDPLFFGISPAEAIYINPEQRLMMQYIWKCIEDAGCGGNDVRGTDTGVFVGCGASAYTSILEKHMPVEAYTATGEVTSVGPNRMSYLMDWHGPSNPIETACSSALVAVHRAVEAIRSGNCEQAIAGGINLLLTPHAYISFSKAGMLAEDGRCKTFSNSANGYVRGEGVGMVMLKPLKQAIKDGNFIYALVKGTAENHGGRTNSLTAPNPKSQAAVIKKAINDAGVDFSRVSYVECHGTGTELGDPVEIKGLKTVASDLIPENSHTQTCMLGSIKSNIGHLEFAAGIAGLIKVVMQIKNKKIAKSLHCDNINPYINLDGTRFKIAQQACDWNVAEGQTRVAGVSSFGFGGVNAHVVLEEYLAGDRHFTTNQDLHQNREQKSQLAVISAKNKDALIAYVKLFREFLAHRENSPEELERITYTLQRGRAEMAERVVFVVDSIADWINKINSYLESNGKIFDRRIHTGTVSASAQGNIEIGDTESGQNYIKDLIRANELEKIAELWVNGTKIDWHTIHA